MSKNLSAVKRVQTALRNRINNKKYKLAIKKSIKSYLLDINNSNIREINEKLSLAYQKIDKGVKVGILHKNKAARYKSKLSKKLTS
uniref:Small ribosomal subunit protein bS20c n=1 Tax=Platysiphonia delicata TaxID=2006979 RepID=A0A1Z1M0H5_9FLOR|nr:ribosomal protein S20 [Platysiphonia delicata]ARW59587.1 ribosomal protein S20 [Platysiphonia delicata]